MKEISNSRICNVIKKDNKGFTLVELLATIAILSVVLTLIIYLSINTIKNAKEKSYSVTINSVEKITIAYVKENNSSMAWKSDASNINQYQCITVQNLIDKGYFKSDVLDSYVGNNIKLKPTDYIYIQRNKNNMTIDKSVLLVSNRVDYISVLCSDVGAIGDINFVVDPIGWGKEKAITIKYNIYGNVDKVSNYKYDYVYDEISLDKKFTNVSMTEKLTIDDNGTLTATIKDSENNIVASNSLIVNKIDKELPAASITSTNDVASYQTATLNISDNAGIASYYFGKVNPSDSDVEWVSVSGELNVQENVRVDSNGLWYLGVKDIVGNVTIISKEFYKTTLLVDNATVTPDTIITMDGNTFTVPAAVANVYYTFKGWYTSSSYSGDVITTYKPTRDSMLYGKVDFGKLTGGSVTIKGTNTYGDTLTAQITDTTPVADSYEYQWYYNSDNSTSDGTAIDGATSSTYTIGNGLTGKYIYVIVTAIKENYDSISFSDITDSSNNTSSTVGGRVITITAKNQILNYGTAISSTISDVTIGGDGLVSGESLTSVILTPSATNVTTSGTITPSAALIKNSSSVDVTSNYDITYNTGTLTINKVSATCPVVTNYSGTYDASAHSITVSGGTGGTIQYRTSADGTWSSTKPARTAGGTTTVYVQVVGDSNHNTVDCESSTIIITKRPITITADAQTVNYGSSIATGTGQVTISGLLTGHTLVSITLTQSTSGVTSSGTITPSAAVIKNSSSTDVTSNYDITYNTGTLKINKVSATCPTVTAYSGTYDGSAHSITVSGGTGGTIQYRTSADGTWSSTKPARTAGGTTTVYVQVVGDSNHSTVDCESSTVTITKRPITITANAQTINYGSSIATGTGQVTIGGSGLASGDSLTSITLTQSTTTVTTSGTITSSAAVIKDSNGTDVTSNYDITYNTGTLKINKVSATCPTVTAYSGTYDGSAHSITVSGGTGGTIQYRTSTDGTWTTTKPTRTSAGTTTVYVQVVGDSNHNAVDCGSKTITINKRVLTVTAKAQTVNYGTAITKTTAQVTIGGSGLASGDSLTSITLTQSTTNVTTSGTITPSTAVIKNSSSTDVTSNYDITYNTGTLKINKVSATCPTVTAYSGTYDGSAHSITVSGGTGGTIQYRTSSTGTWTTTKPTRTSAGTTTVYVQVAGDSNHNTVDCGSKNIAISQKAVTITAKAQTIECKSSIATGTGQVTTSGLLSGHTLASVTLTGSGNTVTTSGTITPSAATINNSSSTAVTSNYSITYTAGKLTVSDTTKPTISLSRTDYNTFTASGSDSCSTVSYYFSAVNTSTAPTASSTWVTTTSKDISGAGTYYAWAKDASGNISDVKSIAAYTVTRSVGTGSSLTTRYDSSSSSTGTAFTSDTAVLSGTNVWAKATAKTGFGSASLKRAGTAATNPSYASVTGNVTIASSATRTRPTVSVTGTVTTNTISASVTATAQNGASISKISYLLTNSTASCNTLSGYKDAGTSTTYSWTNLTDGDYYICVSVIDNVDTTPVYAKSAKITVNLTPFGIYLTNKDFSGATMYGGFYRYSGTTTDVTNNFVCFGTTDKSTCTSSSSVVCNNASDSTDCLTGTNAHMYRVIGVDEYGQVRIIKKEAMGTDNWSTNGTSTWPNSRLEGRINGTYYLNHVNYMPTGWSDKIVTYSWKYGDTKKAPYTNSVKASAYYSTENGWSNTYSAKVGLVYVHDYLYAASLTDSVTKTMRKNSWIHFTNNDTGFATDDREFFISRYGSYAVDSKTYYPTMTSHYDGAIGYMYITLEHYRPVIHLNDSVVYLSGTGTETDPYIIS